MNSKIAEAFAKKAFIAFITGGDPDIETTEKLIPTLEAAGVDVIEIGIPFSDPIAEGLVIQKASERALAAGCTVDKLFAMVSCLRQKVKIPIVFMTYANPIFAYGATRFMANCAASGIDGIIVPDLPFEEKHELAQECKTHGIAQISMIAPTSHQRIKTIAREAEGFLYCVSSLGVTGMRAQINTNLAEMIAEVRSVSKVPCAIGFGISSPAQAREMAAVADGAIIGSAIVKIIAEHGRDCVPYVKKFAEDVAGEIATL
ncbi:MAG: tryptophan synthase subunit alpha [Defluviitaleaceae bacterium]|nr:tryptophan synthase subunit alpha [Defluviitaleaceae bacterium]